MGTPTRSGPDSPSCIKARATVCSMGPEESMSSTPKPLATPT
ncbi:MAG: hypothetical protein QM765_39825 [Myxococcales bacterium]